MKLIVGTDSTWSLRAWICAQLSQVEVTLHIIDLSDPNYRKEIIKHSPTGLVPALSVPLKKKDSLVLHDSLAIAEYFNELSSGELFPNSLSERSAARSLCAELHSGFINLRTQCPFTLATPAPRSEVSDEIEKELSRVNEIFSNAELPFMFKSAGAVDAFYAILAYRLDSYGIKLEGKAGKYQQSLLNWSCLKDAIQLANSWRKN